MSTYAKETTVSVDKSRQEIEAALTRYGADRFAYAWDRETLTAGIEFRLHGRTVRLQVKLPSESDPKFRSAATNQYAKKGAFNKTAFEQAGRQKWRALLLYVKAVLEAIENDIVDIDQAFLFGIVLPNNQTVAQFYSPQIAQAIEQGIMPPALPLLLSSERE